MAGKAALRALGSSRALSSEDPYAVDVAYLQCLLGNSPLTDYHPAPR